MSELQPPSGDDGTVSLVLPLLLWFATILAIVLVDIGGYLVAAARAQTLADSAALAAVSAHLTAGSTPTDAAAAVVAAGDGRLESCRCARHGEPAQVTVSVAVSGLIVPSLGARRVEADATAVLAQPAARPTARASVGRGRALRARSVRA